MPFRENGFCVGADLVRHLTCSSQSAITPDNYQVDFAAREQVAGRIVGDHFMRNSLLVEFPRGQGRALATGPCFIAEYVKLPALLLRPIKRRSGAAVVDKGQPSGVAMCEDAHAGP